MPKGTDVLFICGGKWQLPWLLFLKNKLHRIVLVDPYPDAICVQHADEHIQCDAKDVDYILNSIKDNPDRFCMITSDQTDVSMDTVAIISDKLGIVWNKPEVVKRFSNKLESRKHANSKGIGHIPAFAEINSAEDLSLFSEKLASSEFIIKPADAQSSRGVFLLNNQNKADWQTILSESKKSSKTGTVIAEEFVKGTELTIEGLCLNGKHHTLAISAKKHFRTSIASELRYPAVLNKELKAKIQDYHNDFIESTGLTNAITHAEYIVDELNNKFWLIESACRGGGSLIPSHIVPWVSGVDVYSTYYNALTGGQTEICTTDFKNAILYFFEFQPGFVKSIEGLEAAAELPGVIRIELEFQEGETIKNATDDRGRQGYAIILADSEAELNQKLTDIKNMIHVTIAS
jgi:biotin carboxylase